MTTYSINLDDLDLALLPLRPRTQNDFLKKEYFHFSVMKEETVPKTSDTYTCHICAIEVPTAFASEHAASIKHRANASIANVAMQRTRKNISSHPLHAAARSSERFCANCATVIDEDHDKTKEHRVAVMHDNLLWELMKAYVGDDDQANDHNDDKKKSEDQRTSRVEEKKDDIEFKNGVNNNEKSHAAAPSINKNEVKELIENKTQSNGILNEQKNTKNCEINDKSQEEPKDKAVKKDDTIKSITGTNKNEINQSTNVVATTTSRWVKLPVNKDIVGNGTNQNGVINEVTNKTETNEHTKGNYEAELRKFIDANNTFELKVLYSKIHIKINNDTIYVYSDHFHSYHRMFNTDIECIVCDCIFHKREAETHKYDLNHMSRIAKIGNDGHGVRKVNEAYSHCILCNQKIGNLIVATHKQTKHHMARKAACIKTADKTESNDNKNGGNGNEIQPETNIEIKHPYEEVLGELRCVVCDCRVPRDLRNRKDHVKGFRHVNNLK